MSVFAKTASGWKPTTNGFVKTASGWMPIQKIYKKTAANTWTQVGGLYLETTYYAQPVYQPYYVYQQAVWVDTSYNVYNDFYTIYDRSTQQWVTFDHNTYTYFNTGYGGYIIADYYSSGSFNQQIFDSPSATYPGWSYYSTSPTFEYGGTFSGQNPYGPVLDRITNTQDGVEYVYLYRDQQGSYSVWSERYTYNYTVFDHTVTQGYTTYQQANSPTVQGYTITGYNTVSSYSNVWH